MIGVALIRQLPDGVRTASRALVLVVLIGCGGETTTQPDVVDATINVTVATDGVDLDPDGYSVVIDTAPPRHFTVNSSSGVPVRPGTHVVRLDGLSSNCASSGGTMRSTSVAAGLSATVDFHVDCRIRQVAFSSDRSGTYQVYLMNRDGTNVQRLTNGTDETPGGWSPDGAKLAFTGTVDGKRAVFVVDADGSNRHQLTESAADSRGGTWSPDGKRIAFTSHRDGNDEIYLMDADGAINGASRTLPRPRTVHSGRRTGRR